MCQANCAWIVCAALTGLFALTGYACVVPSERSMNPEPRPVETPFLPANADPEIVTANNRFGLRLFRELAEKELAEEKRSQANVFISPTSVALALEMTYNGAKGDTKTAMAKALELGDRSLEEVNRANIALLSALAKPGEKLELNIANSLWFRSGDAPNPDFVERVRTAYRAEVGDLDGAPDNVNAWVARQTKDKIKTILNSSDLVQAVAVLANAVYFKGAWQQPFDPKQTRETVFTLRDGQKRTCRMMQQAGRFDYLRGQGFQAARLPYGDGRFRMALFLPDEGRSIEALLRELTVENWQAWAERFHQSQGVIGLPRFTSEYEVGLIDALSALGMGLAFDPARADFGGMFAGGGVYISKVKHKTFVEVNEEGTEAAAATAVVATRAAAIQPFRLVLDRPFLCAIEDRQTGALLFLGAILEPTG